jgi:drug/metabolite transporter (DMT)-like permease
MPGYFLLFALFAVGAFVAVVHGGDWGDSVAGVVFVVGSLAFLVITAVLYERMVRCNDARRLAGTPGREYYFGPLVEMWQLISGIVRKRRARRKAAELQR